MAGEYASSFNGYAVGAAGSLTPNTFDIDGTEFEIRGVLSSFSAVSVSLNGILPNGSTFRLHVGSTSYELGFISGSNSGSTYGYSQSFDSPIFTVGQSYSLRLTYEPPPPTVTLEGPAPARVAEGDPRDARKELAFTVRLSRADDQDVTANVAFSSPGGAVVFRQIANPESAADDGYINDVLYSDASLTVPAGRTEASFSVWVVGDDRPEEDETFTVTLSNLTNTSHPAGHTIQASATIVDDDGPVLGLTAGSSGARLGFSAGSYGSLSPGTFDIEGTAFRVRELYSTGAEARLVLDRDLPGITWCPEPLSVSDSGCTA